MGQLNQIKKKSKLLHVELYLEKDYRHEINISEFQLLNQQVIHHNRTLKKKTVKIKDSFSIKSDFS
jgi:hypothetical protein